MKAINTLISTLKKGFTPSAKTLSRVQTVLPPQTYNKLLRYIRKDKRISLKNLIIDLQKYPRIQRGSGWNFSMDSEEGNYQLTVHDDDEEAATKDYVITHDDSYHETPRGDEKAPTTTQPIQLFTEHTKKYQVTLNPSSVIGEGTYAAVYSIFYKIDDLQRNATESATYVARCYKQEADIARYQKNIKNIHGALKTDPSLLERTSFTTDMIETPLQSCMIFRKAEGSLKDAFTHLDNSDKVDNNIVWFKYMIKQTKEILPQLVRKGIIHADIKLENILYLDNKVLIHDFDCSLLITDPIMRQHHTFTVRYTHPLYFVYVDMFYPKSPTTKKTLDKNLPLSMIWNVYLACETQKVPPNTRVALFQAHKALFYEIHQQADKSDPQEIVNAFVGLTREDYVSSLTTKYDDAIDQIYPSGKYTTLIHSWKPYFDEFSLEMSTFIKATTWYANYQNEKEKEKAKNPSNVGKIDSILERINEFCLETLKNLRDITQKVFKSLPPPSTAGGSIRRRRMKAGTPTPPTLRKSTTPNPTFDNFMKEHSELPVTRMTIIESDKCIEPPESNTGSAASSLSRCSSLRQSSTGYYPNPGYVSITSYNDLPPKP